MFALYVPIACEIHTNFCLRVALLVALSGVLKIHQMHKSENDAM